MDEPRDEQVDVAADRRDRGMRLHAARLSSGRYEIARAIEDMGVVPDPTYRAVEKGNRLLTPSLAQIAGVCFGVSEAFLLEGLQDAGDGAAVSMLDLLRRLDEAGVRRPDHAFRHRLQRRRREAGFRSATAAANTFGWVRSRYTDHENGRRSIPLDQAIRYAEKLAEDPYAFIIPPPPMAGRPETSASTAGTPALHGVPTDPPWHWLDMFGRSMTARTIRAPVVALMRSGAELLPDPMSVPSMLVPDASNDDALYWLLDIRGKTAPAAYLLKPGASNGDKVMVTGSGIWIGRKVPEEAVPADPLGATPPGGPPLIFGTLRHILRLG